MAFSSNKQGANVKCNSHESMKIYSLETNIENFKIKTYPQELKHSKHLHLTSYFALNRADRAK